MQDELDSMEPPPQLSVLLLKALKQLLVPKDFLKTILCGYSRPHDFLLQLGYAYLESVHLGPRSNE